MNRAYSLPQNLKPMDRRIQLHDTGSKIAKCPHARLSEPPPVVGAPIHSWSFPLHGQHL